MENLNVARELISKISGEEIFQMSDKDLYKKCQELGSFSLHYRRKFCGLLPEVNRRRLFEKYGFRSLYEFSSKLAGLTNDVVDKILSLEQKLLDKPILKGKLEKGEIGYSKLRIIAAVAKPENQKMWVQKAEQMSKETLEVYVRGIKEQQERPGAGIPACPAGRSNEQSLFEMSNLQEQAREEKETFSCKMNPRLIAKLKVYRKRLEKEENKQMSWEDVFEKLLEKKKAVAQAAMKKKALPKALPTSSQVCLSPEKHFENDQNSSRHIPAAIERDVEARSEGICEYPNCFKPAEHFHHTERFALTGRHMNIRNLCNAHHELAYNGLIEAEEQDPSEWKLRLFSDLDDPKFEVDRAMRKFSTLI